MANPFCHLELDTTDPTKAKAFYSSLFDWKITDSDMGGGMMKHPMPGAPSTWLAYVLVDDVAAATKKAVSLGAKIAVDKQEVPKWAGSASSSTPPALPLVSGKPTHPPQRRNQPHKTRLPEAS